MSKTIQLELNNSAYTQRLEDYHLEKRDNVLELGFFCLDHGLNVLEEKYTSDVLAEMVDEKCHTLNQSQILLKDENQRLRLEKDKIRMDTEKTLESNHQLRHQLEEETQKRLRDEIKQLQSQLLEYETKTLKQSEREMKLLKENHQQEKQHLLDVYQIQLKSLEEKSKIEISSLENLLSEKEALISKWKLSSNQDSGNVAKGNLGEQLLKEMLQINLPSVLKTEVRVSDVSKGKGGNADLLLELPERGLNILIESKYKTSEKVRTNEIQRMRHDLCHNVHGAHLLVAVSFESGFTGYHHHQLELVQDQGILRLLSFEAYFSKSWSQDGGQGLCHWIDFLSRIYPKLVSLGGKGHRTGLENINEGLQKSLEMVYSLEKTSKRRMELEQTSLKGLQSLSLQLLPELINRVDSCLTNGEMEEDKMKSLVQVTAPSPSTIQLPLPSLEKKNNKTTHYKCFLKDKTVRREMKESLHKELGRSPKFGEISKAMGQHWKSLSQEEKQKWK